MRNPFVEVASRLLWVQGSQRWSKMGLSEQSEAMRAVLLRRARGNFDGSADQSKQMMSAHSSILSVSARLTYYKEKAKNILAGEQSHLDGVVI